jgi:hypothetical protein
VVEEGAGAERLGNADEQLQRLHHPAHRGRGGLQSQAVRCVQRRGALGCWRQQQRQRHCAGVQSQLPPLPAPQQRCSPEGNTVCVPCSC